MYALSHYDIGRIAESKDGTLTVAGAEALVGTIGRLPAGAIIGYIDSTGTLMGGPEFRMSADYRNDPAEYTELSVPETAGDSEWVLVFNDTGSAILRGKFVEWDGTANAYGDVQPISAAAVAAKAKGVMQFDLPAGKAGWALRHGVGTALVGAATNLTAGASIELGTNGDVIAAGAGDAAVGYTLENASGFSVGDAVKVFVDCRG